MPLVLQLSKCYQELSRPEEAVNLCLKVRGVCWPGSWMVPWACRPPPSLPETDQPSRPLHQAVEEGAAAGQAPHAQPLLPPAHTHPPLSSAQRRSTHTLSYPHHPLTHPPPHPQACLRSPCATVWLRAGLAHAQLGEGEQCRAALAEAVRLDAESADAWAALWAATGEHAARQCALSLGYDEARLAAAS